MWVQLAELYGKSFYREHADQPTNLWIQSIAKLTDQGIQTGLINLANDCLEFPANLGQFVSACKRESLAPPYWNTPRIEDQRPMGNMSLEDWNKQNE